MHSPVPATAVHLRRQRHAIPNTYDIWAYLSWGLTLLRFPLLFLCLSLLSASPYSTLVPVTIAFIIVADILDGELFRLSSLNLKRSCRIFRHAFDAAGDRIVIHSVLLVALYKYSMHPAIPFAIAIRELILIAIVLQPFHQNGIVLKANTPSKLATACIGIIVAAFSLNLGTFVLPTFILFIAFAIPGLYLYVNRPEVC